MKRAVSSVLFIVLSMVLMASTSRADTPAYGVPQVIEPSARYLLFFHNYYVETKGPDGDCKYYDILNAFAGRGFAVISEIRPKDASVADYAKKGTAAVRKLLDAGVPPQNITVAGHSKGAVIALQVAALLERPKVNYVIMAGCGIKGLEKGYPDSSRLTGNLLSVYAASDKVAGSCSTFLSRAGQDLESREIVLESAAGHQLFFTPADAWFAPVIGWLNQAK